MVVGGCMCTYFRRVRASPVGDAAAARSLYLSRTVGEQEPRWRIPDDQRASFSIPLEPGNIYRVLNLKIRLPD